MKSIPRALFATLLPSLALVIFFENIACAQPVTDPTFDPAYSSALQTTLNTGGVNAGIKNLSACVYVPGQGTWVGVYNSPGAIAISTDSRFGIASNSKSFVAGVCLRLSVEGLLDLDEPISAYLPNLAQTTPYVDGSITTRQLLSHQAGLFDFYNQASNATLSIFNADPDKLWQPEEILATIGAPNHTPGSSFYYSNTHFLVAAMVCEAATGKTFGQLLQEKIAVPLGLQRTNFPAGGDMIAGSPFANLYNSSGSIALDMAHANSFWSTIHAAGGIASTPYDMVNWYRNGLFEKNPPSGAGAVFLDFTTQMSLFSAEPWSGYSLGLRAQNPEVGGSVFYHAGIWGYRSYALHDRETGITIAVMGNVYGISVNSIAIDLLDVALSQLPPKNLDLNILDVIYPQGQVCGNSVTGLQLLLENKGIQPISEAQLTTSLDTMSSAAQSQAVSFNPPIQPGEIRLWESPDWSATGGGSITQLNVQMTAGNDYYPFHAAERSWFLRRADGGIDLQAGDFMENFSENNQGPLPAGWISYQQENALDWRTTHFTGNGGALCKNLYNDGALGKIYYLELPMMTLPGSSTFDFGFDYAYALYPGYAKDSLAVELSEDCGNTWTTLWQKGGLSLSTSSATSNSFIPASNQWEGATLNIPGGVASSDKIIRFKIINNFGNNIWLDNIRTGLLVDTKEWRAAFEGAQFSPNPFHTNSVLTLPEPVFSASLSLYDALGKKVMTRSLISGTQIEIFREGLPDGAYYYNLTENGTLLASGKILVQ
ncbi:MAG: serine hydrolase [Saprospiraceae bacterium]|nr:serine hydrolase [Saprospiraceae bacterium]